MANEDSENKKSKAEDIFLGTVAVGTAGAGIGIGFGKELYKATKYTMFGTWKRTAVTLVLGSVLLYNNVDGFRNTVNNTKDGLWNGTKGAYEYLFVNPKVVAAQQAQAQANQTAAQAVTRAYNANREAEELRRQNEALAKKFKELTAKPSQPPQASQPLSAEATSVINLFYIVKSGETLSEISSRTLGTVSKYTTIASQNGIADPSNVAAGTLLRFNSSDVVNPNGLITEAPARCVKLYRGERLEDRVVNWREIRAYNQELGNNCIDQTNLGERIVYVR